MTPKYSRTEGIHKIHENRNVEIKNVNALRFIIPLNASLLNKFLVLSRSRALEFCALAFSGVYRLQWVKCPTLLNVPQLLTMSQNTSCGTSIAKFYPRIILLLLLIKGAGGGIFTLIY